MFFKELTLPARLGCKPVPLMAYVPDVYDEIDPERVRPAIILCPGGGYRMRSRTEAEPVALRYVAHGINVFILEYSVAPEHYPTQLRQLAAAVAFVRQNAELFHTDPNRIFVSGFFTALNDGLTSALISFLRTLLFQSAAVLLMPLIWGLDGIWYSVIAAEALAVLVTVIFMLGKRKKYKY